VRSGIALFDRLRPATVARLAAPVRAFRTDPRKPDVRVRVRVRVGRWCLMGDSGGVAQAGPEPRRASDSARSEGKVGAAVMKVSFWDLLVVVSVRDWERRYGFNVIAEGP
jgi:hypothetical protein